MIATESQFSSALPISTTTTSFYRDNQRNSQWRKYPFLQPNTELIDHSIPKSTYYDENYRQSAALIRARRPYLVKNIITGAGLFALTIGICKGSLQFIWIFEYWWDISLDVYTIRAVSQDEFEDVRVPDAPIQQPRGAAPGSIAKAIEAKKWTRW